MCPCGAEFLRHEGMQAARFDLLMDQVQEVRQALYLVHGDPRASRQGVELGRKHRRVDEVCWSVR
jgi:hypothetical protein